MMREIKFRAWNKKLKRFAPEDCSIQIQGDDAHVAFDTFNGNFDTEVWDLKDVDLLQFTGLVDLNGADIYEGDIIKPTKSAWCVGGIGMIAFSGGAFVNRKSDADCIFHGINSVHHEIIGNIYENPELIK